MFTMTQDDKLCHTDGKNKIDGPNGVLDAARTIANHLPFVAIMTLLFSLMPSSCAYMVCTYLSLDDIPACKSFADQLRALHVWMAGACVKWVVIYYHVLVTLVQVCPSVATQCTFEQVNATYERIYAAYKVSNADDSVENLKTDVMGAVTKKFYLKSPPILRNFLADCRNKYGNTVFYTDAKCVGCNGMFPCNTTFFPPRQIENENKKCRMCTILYLLPKHERKDGALRARVHTERTNSDFFDSIVPYGNPAYIALVVNDPVAMEFLDKFASTPNFYQIVHNVLCWTQLKKWAWY